MTTVSFKTFNFKCFNAVYFYVHNLKMSLTRGYREAVFIARMLHNYSMLSGSRKPTIKKMGKNILVQEILFFEI